MTKVSLDADLRAAHAAYRDALAGLSEADLATPYYGRFSSREITAHLSGWHRQLAPMLDRIARGEPSNPDGDDYSPAGIDRQNDRFAAEVGGQTHADLLAQLDANVARFLEAGQAIPDALFEPGKIAHLLYQNAGIRHFTEHTAALRAWRAIHGNEPQNP